MSYGKERIHEHFVDFCCLIKNTDKNSQHLAITCANRGKKRYLIGGEKDEGIILSSDLKW